MEGNNGTGFLPPPTIPKKNVISLPEIPEAQTPVFNELMSKVSDARQYGQESRGKPGYYPQSELKTVDRYGYANYIDELLYHEYIQKLRNTYPKCIIKDNEITPVTSGSAPLGGYSPFAAAKGVHHYQIFEKLEKRCFLQPFIEARQNAEGSEKFKNLLDKHKTVGFTASDLKRLSKNELNRLKKFEIFQSLERSLLGGRRVTKKSRNSLKRNKSQRRKSYSRK